MIEKKRFDKLYFVNNIDNKAVLIKLVNSITYSSFFVLTKLVHSSFIKFQINKCLLGKSIYSCFLLLNYDGEIVREVITYYDTFKDFLTRIKRIVIKRNKILNDVEKIKEIDDILEFVVYLGNTDIRYKHSSLYQVKSLFKRKKKILQDRIDNSEIFFTTTTELVVFYYKVLCLSWHLMEYFPELPETSPIPLNISTILNEDTEIQTISNINISECQDMNMFSVDC